MKRMLGLLWLVLLVFINPGQAASPQPVTVGGYVFPPYVVVGQDGRPEGITPALIAALNEIQNQYQFEFFLTSARRRFQDFEDGKFDMLFFESMEWGWRSIGARLDQSPPLLSDDEVWIALAGEGRDQQFLSTLKGRRIAGILGYHYRFADFESDPDVLRKRFDITLVNTNSASIELIMKGRVDQAIVTRSYLNDYLERHPEYVSRLLVSDFTDQNYSLRMLVRHGVSPGVGELESLLMQLRDAGTLKQLFRKIAHQP